MDERVDELRALADATRELNRLVRITQADAAATARAQELIAEASSLLASDTYDGPHAQTGLGGDVMMRLSPRPADFFPYSPVVGPLNPVAPPVELEMTEDGRAVGTVTLTEPYNGPPWDLTHGGVVALIFDELLGIAGIAGAGGGFTGRLTVRYHRPTPIGQAIALEAHVTDVRGRKIKVEGTMHADGILTAEAEGLFIKAAGVLSDATPPG
jgi:acyl-coenzyme A thioesterase PaaI-like protein